ncbi:flagellar hook protein FlgE [Cryobacterium levicorallinum]|uniref:Flagellar hook protein FlgE n=1 Tax=Cryobacterium levicorallinum TaxID=995038 RepID=A0A1I3BRC9_9MICO|nr:flagellar hook protein FlgE [Cryobacterium levicorallinum]TFB83113.1 flagellar hook protein FlgE [Cryobacterium levicorallinum]GEP25404.1 flagellar hook protein FlgE [Cryobacterium levicorallinum]SFH64793.1 flagellar hook protein FlgE [Cryobacterium levicorallinum]
MLRSLYSGISGLRSHQAMLDVTGNNIANVNTTGFKASAAQFQDTLSQLTSGAGAPQGEVGGTNPAQIGLGVQVAGISTNFSQGSSQATGKSTDLLISGDGLFITKMGGETLYTRAGSFDFDSAGRLVTPDGSIVQGWGANNGVVADGGPTSNITLPVGAIIGATKTTGASFGGNLPSDAEEDTELTRDFEVFDALGASSTVTLTFTRVFDSAAGTDGWDVAEASTGYAASLTSTGVAGTFDFTGDTSNGTIDIDLGEIKGFAGLTSVSGAADDGNAAGTLNSYTLSADGTLVGLFSNGEQLAIGRIALANFVNPGGLEKAGGSAYRATFNSGDPTIGTAGTNGLGSLSSGALEMSNVDLSQEFTNLIVAQRGFQANARIITTSDEVLQELTNLKR